MESKTRRAVVLSVVILLATVTAGVVSGGGIDAATEQSVSVTGVDVTATNNTTDGTTDNTTDNETTTNETTDNETTNETTDNETTNETTDNETTTNETTDEGPSDPGPVKNLPDSFAEFPDTSPLTPGQLSTPSLAGKIRVESQYARDTTVDLVRNSSTEYTLSITIPSELNATNVTFYLNAQAIESSQNISNVVAYIDGNQTVFGTTQANNNSWVAWEVDHFSTRNVTFTSNTTENETTENETTTNETTENETTTNETTDDETTTNETTTNETDGGPTDPGPVQGLPSGVASFLETSPLTPQQASPPSLAGKMRVESEYASDTTVELLRNSSTDYTIAITIPSELNATNVTFYLQKEAVESSQNISNVVAEVDGEPIAFGTTNASNASWIAFEVDHFSTRNVTFTSNTSNTTGPPALPGFDSAPTNADGDAALEDVNGNGGLDIGDVQALFANRASDVVQNNVAEFDFNGNGRIDIGDIQSLFVEYRSN